MGLALGIVGLLVLPRLAIAVRTALAGDARGFGGAARLFASGAAELALSSIVAPILLMYHSRSVFDVLRGRDGGWPSSQRGEGRPSLGEAWAASAWITLAGGIAVAVVWRVAPALLPWSLPVCLPMLLAPPIIWATSLRSRDGPFLVPLEREPSDVVLGYERWRERWASGGAHERRSPRRCDPRVTA